MKAYEIVQLPIKRKQERVYLDPALASRLEPIQLKAGLSASTLIGKLDARDNKFSLKASCWNLGENALDVSYCTSNRKSELAFDNLVTKWKYSLQVLPEEEGGTLYNAYERMLPRHPWGSVDTTKLVHLLNQHGLMDTRIEDTPRGVVIHLVNWVSLFLVLAPCLAFLDKWWGWTIREMKVEDEPIPVWWFVSRNMLLSCPEIFVLGAISQSVSLLIHTLAHYYLFCTAEGREPYPIGRIYN